MEEENKNVIDESIKQLKTKIEAVNTENIQLNNIDYLYKVVDVYKDLLEIKNKEENMRYGNYNEGSYGRRGVPGSGRGYRDSGNYGRRYRGNDMLNEMQDYYGEYIESGNYGGVETMKALKYMLKSAEDFFRHIQEEAQSPEEMEMVKETARRISEM